MVMVSGAGGLHRKGGRSPPPKRGRLGGGRCAAAPYKHRLAHAPGRRSRSGRAFRCVGVLGVTPSRFWTLLASQKCHPAGQAYRLKLFVKLRPAKGEMKLCHSLCRQSLRHGCAVPPLFAQGRLWVYRQATANLANSLLLLLRGKAAFRRRAAIFPRRVGKAGKNRMNTGKKA